MIRNSFRQLFRMKIRTILFFGLMLLCALMICLGFNLFSVCRENIARYKETFVTIGTVEQEPTSYVTEAQYDAESMGYTYINEKKYGDVFSIDDLPAEDEEVTYISGPERRPFYHTYLPQFCISKDNTGFLNEIIVEASPIEDCIPNGPVKMIIHKSYFNVYKLTIENFYFCDHFNPHPEKMYADKTYVMSLRMELPHGWDHLTAPTCEYIPSRGPFSEQTTADGTKIPNELPNLSFEEVNDEFYAKGHDQYWNAYAKEMDMLFHTVPVTPTDDLNLLMSFYNNDVTVVDGRAISEEDFAVGNPVCMISSLYAKDNDIKVGDVITLPLRSADYGFPAIMDFWVSPLTAQGKNFDVFFEDDYTVVGTYRMLPTGGNDWRYTLDRNEVIIPKKSIKADDSGNIGYYGEYVSQFNTSFRIPNGTIDEFMEKWEEKGIKDVKIHFYDKGYSKLEAGMIQMEQMAVLLLGAGLIMTILVLLFFSHMMIGGQKKRTAIERSLGASKKESMCSLLTGILVVAAGSSVVGCMAGTFLTQSVAVKMAGQQIFDRTYSAGAIYSEILEEQTVQGNLLISAMAFSILFICTALISGITAWRNLKEEPMTLLSERN